jgi:hypothetical protein
MPTLPGVPMEIVPADTFSTVVSVSPLLGLSATEMPASETGLPMAPLNEVGTVSLTVAVSATVMPAVCAPVLLPSAVSVVVIDSVSLP